MRIIKLIWCNKIGCKGRRVWGIIICRKFKILKRSCKARLINFNMIISNINMKIFN